MNWSRAKSIFLVTFLILDLFLGYQLYSKRKNADEFLPNNKQSPQEIMTMNGIEWPSNYQTIKTAAYIRGTSMSFVSNHSSGDQGNNSNPNESGKSNKDSSQSSSERKKKKNKKSLKKDIQDYEKDSNGQKIQDIQTSDETTIISNLKQPQEVPIKSNNRDFSDFLKKYVYNGEKYTLWKKGGDNTPYVFVQAFNSRPVFSKGQSAVSYSGGQFPPGTLKIYMADGKIYKYEQSYLSLEQYKKKKDIISPLKEAVFSLYRENDFSNNSTVDLIELSYYNLIEKDLSNVRLFVPAWHIIVHDKKSGKEKEFFVNAITQGVITPNKQEQTGG